MDADELAAIDAFVSSHETFVHVTHVSPDADGLGSALAFSRHLTAIGKESRVALPAPVPSKLDFLVEPDEVLVVGEEPEAAAAAVSDTSAVVLYDVAATERLGSLGPVACRAPARMVFDHHDAECSLDALSILDPSAGATAEVVQGALEGRGVRLDLALALPLYVALVSDTGSFNYGKTTPRSHHMAARLLEAGVDPLEVHGLLEGRRTLRSLRATGRALTTLTRDGDDPRVAHATVDRALIDELGADELESGELVNATISLDGVRAGVLLVETAPGTTRVSLRSKGRTSIVEVAKALGGGGHRNAAGAMLEASADAVRERVLGLLRGAVRTQHGPVSDG